MAFAEVYLRELLMDQRVKVTSINKPEIPGDIKNHWQKILNSIAEIFDVPSSLIMKINPKNIVVFLSSKSANNPYKKGDQEQLKKGLYCETVIGERKELLIKDALNNSYWKDNPDVELGMISYYGLPILWPDEEIFGTICVLDHKRNKYSEKYKNLLRKFKASIEKDLKYLMIISSLKKTVNIDVLTGIYNRRKATEILKNEMNRSMRGEPIFSVALIDLDKFKGVNDTYGHEAGDKLLKRVANLFKENIRIIDRFCRWGGDEFVLICPNTNSHGITKLLNKIRKELMDQSDYFYNINFSYGIASYKPDDQSYEDLLLRADQKMYGFKKSK